MHIVEIVGVQIGITEKMNMTGNPLFRDKILFYPDVFSLVQFAIYVKNGGGQFWIFLFHLTFHHKHFSRPLEIFHTWL